MATSTYAPLDEAIAAALKGGQSCTSGAVQYTRTDLADQLVGRARLTSLAAREARGRRGHWIGCSR